MSQSSSSSALSSPIRVCGFSSPSATPESYERLRHEKSMGTEEVSSSGSTLPGLEEVGTKRAAGDEEVAHPTPDYSLGNNSVSSIVKRAKRLQINDQVAENTHPLIRPLRFKPLEAQKETARLVASREILISAYPSLVGIPEELVLDIVFYLDVFDIMSLRKTNRRLSYITRARVIWVIHLSSILDQVKLPKNAATFLDSRLSTSALEQIVKRPHAFALKWFYSRKYQHNPSSSQALSVVWYTPHAFRLPTLLPGGRWLVAVCGNRRQANHAICLWDLEHGRTKGFPEAQMEAPGMVLFVDIKMDLTGSFAYMAVLSCKLNVAMTLVLRIDVYQIKFLSKSFGFFHIDSLPLNERKAHEVLIYPEYGHVLVDLFDRVLIWAYSPMKKCAWMITSKNRNRYQRFAHRSAHAIARTHDMLLVADGDEGTLRWYDLPPLLNRPTQLNTLPLYLIEPAFEQPLPQYSMSLRFSDNRFVDISGLLEAQASRLKQAARNSAVAPNGTGSVSNTAAVPPNNEVVDDDYWLLDTYPAGRGVLFIDASDCESYLFCSYPLEEISEEPDSPNALIWTSVSREVVFEQIRRGDPQYGSVAHMGMNSSVTSLFNIRPITISPATYGMRCGGDILWIGDVDMINPSLCASNEDPKARSRTVVLMRNPNHAGGLIIISTFRPPEMDSLDLKSGQSVMSEVEQGEARVILGRYGGRSQGQDINPQMRIEEASVDSISGRMCIIESTPLEGVGSLTDYACVLRLLEYS